MQAGENLPGTVGKRNGTIIIAGPGAHFRLYCFNHGNAQITAGQGTHQAGTYHATADNNDIILVHI
jgi:hypothetical protein